MKLETKHIAAYLPYKLKVRVEDYKCDYVNREFDEVIGLHQWDKSGLLWSALTDGGAKPSLDRIKPVLRTLSDLTKEIEVNGEKFVPIEYNAFKHSKNDIVEFQNRFIYYKGMKYGIIERLLEWHFDIFGLIDKNLAININNLNK